MHVVNEVTQHSLKRVHFFPFCNGWGRGGGGLGEVEFFFWVLIMFSTCSHMFSMMFLNGFLEFSMSPHFIPILCPKFSPSLGYALHPHIEIVILGSIPSFRFF
jgi:hypothetical protein